MHFITKCSLFIFSFYLISCFARDVEIVINENDFRKVTSHGEYNSICNEPSAPFLADHVNSLTPIEELNVILKKKNFKGTEVIDFLSRNSELKILFLSDAGVSEGYSIKEHTQMVYNAFIEQSPHFEMKSIKTPSNIDIERLLRFVISVHDIGKPIAVAKEGKHAQHKYTTPILKETMTKLGFTAAEVTLAISLVDNDILGEVMQGQISIKQAHPLLSQLANENNMTLKDYFQLQSFLYTADASSYPRVRQIAFEEKKGKLIPIPSAYHELEAITKK